METKVIKNLIKLKEKLNDVIDVDCDILTNQIKSDELSSDIEKNVIDLINETIENIEIILENIDNGDYDSLDDEVFNHHDY